MATGKVKSGIGIEFTGDRINLVKLAKTSQGIILAEARSIKLSVIKKEEYKKILSENIIKTFGGIDYAKNELSLGVGGHMSFVRKVKLPPVSHSKLKQVVSFEVQQQVPFSLNEVIWDHQVISPFSKIPGPIIVLISAIKQSFVEDLLKILKESINKTPDIVDASSLALHNCLVFNDLLPKEKVGILINLGFSYTDVSIENKGEMAFTRAVPIGRRNILKKIAEARGIEIEKAEEILGREDVSSIILSIWEDLVAEIKRTTNYYLSQIEKVTHFQYIFISGEFPKDDNLVNLLKNSFRVEVKEINPFNKIRYDPAKLTVAVGNFCISTGLALRSLEHLPVEINLLPPQLLSKKHLANKRLCFISSFVVLFLIGWLILILITRSYNLINEKINIVKPTLDSYRPYVSRVETLKNERRSFNNKMQSIEVILKQKSQLSDILIEISHLTPTNIYITQISNRSESSTLGEEGTTRNTAARTSIMEEMPSSRNIRQTKSKLTDRISLSGITASYPTVDEYIKQLRTSSLFKTVELISVTSTLTRNGGEISSGGAERTLRERGARVEKPRTMTADAAQKEEVNFTLEIILDLSRSSIGKGLVK